MAAGSAIRPLSHPSSRAVKVNRAAAAKTGVSGRSPAEAYYCRDTQSSHNMVLQLRSDLGGLSFQKTKNLAKKTKKNSPQKSPTRAVNKSLEKAANSPVREALAKIWETISLDDVDPDQATNITQTNLIKTQKHPSNETEVTIISDSSKTKMVKLRMGRKVITELMEVEETKTEVVRIPEPALAEETESKKPLHDSPLTSTRRSNSMNDAVRVICKICSSKQFLTGIRAHTKTKHQMSITEYREKHGKLEMVEEVQHECLLCAETFLLDSDTLARHLKRSHRAVAYKDYSIMMGVMQMAGA